MGTDEDPEKWSGVHEKVVNRYRSIDGDQMPEVNDIRTINILWAVHFPIGLNFSHLPRKSRASLST